MARKSKSAWSLERAEPVCASVAKWAARKFWHLKEFDYEDLVSQSIQLSLEQHEKYRPRPGWSYEAWLRVCLRNRLVSLLRSRDADHKRCRAVAKSDVYIDIDLVRAKAGLTRRTGRCCRRRFRPVTEPPKESKP